MFSRSANGLFISLVVIYGSLGWYTSVLGRRHNLTLEDETRKNFAISTFGFMVGGSLMTEILEFSFDEKALDSSMLENNFGFSIEKTASDGVSNYMEQHSEKCVLQDKSKITDQVSLVLFTLNLKHQRIQIDRASGDFKNMEIFDDRLKDQPWSHRDFLNHYVENTGFVSAIQKLDKVQPQTKLSKGNHQTTPRVAPTTAVPPSAAPTLANVKTGAPASTLKQQKKTSKKPRQVEGNGSIVRQRRLLAVGNRHLTTYLNFTKRGQKYHGRFTMFINEPAHEGLYNVYFHNCYNYIEKGKVKTNLKLRIIENNNKTFLSAGEIPLPILYGLMSIAFFVTGCAWVAFLGKHREWTFKIHYIMASLMFLKSFSLAFHALNFYYIGRDGRPMETWAVLYYITHLLKGALLFTTIVLIGTGFFFVKHVLSTKEKRIFIIVIPLQILTNVAQIMTESTEEGKAQYTTWHQIFILVDLICCGAILFPVVWSIRHLQEAAKTDGKAAISLAKLKLFRHFYVMIVCYIYFTRIIVYLIKITVPFKFMWLDEFFTEMASYVFFVLTGYKFRPAPTNPYLHVPEDDDDEDDIEMDEITMQSGLAEGLTRLHTSNRKSQA